MRPLIWLLVGGLALLAPVASAQQEDDSIKAKFAKLSSPDGRFAVALAEGDGNADNVVVEEKKTRRVVANLSDAIMEPETLALVWAPDSKSFAANFRAGGRYHATSQFRWDGRTFVELASPEGALYDKVVEPARQRELKAAGKPADTYLRRIWDTWETVKWIDGQTVEIHGESIAAYYEDDEATDIAVGVQATVRFDKDGAAKILEATEVPARD